MEDLARPRQPRLAACWLFVLAAVALARGEPVEVVPRWAIQFPAAAGSSMTASSAVVPVDAGPTVVAVVGSGANPASPALFLGARSLPVEVIGHDPVSRLAFFRITGPQLPKPLEWASSAEGTVGESLRALVPGGEIQCLATGWVKQVGRKILPLALLHVNFDRTVPSPGTPLVDREGRVVAVMFQRAAGPEQSRSGYAIPAEAVHRVRRDVCAGGSLVRGWLGLSLRSENLSPQVVRVLPGSPASAAGILPGDVLASVGQHRIASYPDAANAFFYLVPGQPVTVKLMRGVRQLEVSLTPVKPQAE